MIGSFGHVLTNYRPPVIGSAGYFAAGAALAKQGPGQSGLLTEPEMAHSSPLHWWGKQKPMSETR
jgi:hypothetical protein